MVPVRCGGGAAGLRAAVAAGEPTPRTLLVRGDMHALAGLRGSADLVVAVNSISPERPGRAAQMFEQVAACLKPGGVLMAVLASLDAFQYLTTMAARLGVALPDAGRVDARGMFHEGGEQQQFFTPGDIRALCAATALRVVRLQKVRYPWRLMQRFGWGYFPGRPRLWDWHLVAQAPGTRVGRRT